jgi:hypothetical protein
MTRQRLDLREAAEVLGATVDAVRKRVQRGSLDSEKGEDGRVYVWLDVDQTQPERQGPALVEEVRDRVRFLERLLEEEREARTEERRRHDTLMAQLMSRIPELEAPATSEPPGGSETATEQPGRVGPQPAVESTQEAQESHEMHMPEVHGGPLPRDQHPPSERPWWRRMFGG